MTRYLSILLLLLSLTPLRAEFLQLDLSIFGMDCMTCAYAVRGALKKLPGVESVDVSLNKGLATMRLKPGNTLQVPAVWEAVRRNGFTPRETRVVVRGDVVAGGSTLQLKVSGTSEPYDFTARAADVLGETRKLAGRAVVVEGTLTPAKDPKTAVPIEAAAVRADNGR